MKLLNDGSLKERKLFNELKSQVLASKLLVNTCKNVLQTDDLEAVRDLSKNALMQTRLLTRAMSALRYRICMKVHEHNGTYFCPRCHNPVPRRNLVWFTSPHCQICGQSLRRLV